MIDTPKTDRAYAMSIQTTTGPVEALRDFKEFAEQLERNLADAQERLARIKEQCYD